MRDPNRINKVLNNIKKVWEEYPDMRLMQLLINAVGDSPAVYYMEDERMTELLRKYYFNTEERGDTYED